LRPEWLVDGTGAAAQRGQSVVVRDGLIAEVAPAESASASSVEPSIDLPGVSLLPGLINNHVHLNLPGVVGEPFLPWLAVRSDTALALHGVRAG
jgi:imidazolonepropionase-like amidohydrolase